MEYIEIDGGRKLSGEILLSGSKNSALPILACSLLSDKSVNLTNVPDLLDIKSMINLIESLGVKIKKKNNNYILTTKNVLGTRLKVDENSQSDVFESKKVPM